MWGIASCLRKQHFGRDWSLSHQLSDLKSNVLTTASPTPPPPHPQCMQNLGLNLMFYTSLCQPLTYSHLSGWSQKTACGSIISLATCNIQQLGIMYYLSNE